MPWLAIAFLVFFYLHPRIALVLGVGLGLFLALAAAAMKDMEQQLAAITVRPSHAPGICGPEALLVTIENGADRKIAALEGYIEGRNRGFSDTTWSARYESYRYLAPGAAWRECVPLPARYSRDALPPD
ncbi:hypothetical protein LAZ40_00750, partial [Cereibacter sphaeroides]|uniref:hypothetical protein n=1 Tax=Cereibacter sphaeroides TaxID=1063 RepID=UPI001F1F1705